MQTDTTDDLWFRANPHRDYRLRRQTPAEIVEWQVSPTHGHIAWCLIRRADGAVQPFALVHSEVLDDHDEELKPLFEEFQRRAA